MNDQGTNWQANNTRINIIINKQLLGGVDVFAKERGISRSRLVREALRAYVPSLSSTIRDL